MVGGGAHLMHPTAGRIPEGIAIPTPLTAPSPANILTHTGH